MQPFTLKDAEIRIWSGALGREPSAKFGHVIDVRTAAFRNQWRPVQKADGSYSNINTGRRIDLNIVSTLVIDSELINILNSDSDIFLRLSLFNTPADPSHSNRIGHILCQDGRIDSYDLVMGEGGYATIAIKYFSNVFTISLA